MTPDFIVPLSGASGAAAIALGILATKARGKAAFLVATAALAGCMLGCAKASELTGSARVLEAQGASGIVMTLAEDSSDGAFASSARCLATVPNGGGVYVSATFPLGTRLLSGEVVVCSGSLSSVDYGESAYYWNRGIVGRFAVRDFDLKQGNAPWQPIVGIRRKAIEFIGAQDAGHALLEALACGYRPDIAEAKEYSSFQAAGLAHLVAVSGAHLVIVTGLFSALLKRLGFPRRISIVLLVCAMAAYLVLSGSPVSALRASIMSSVGILALFGKRRPSALNALGIGTFAIITASPLAAVSASFALSALSTAGIILFAPLISDWLGKTPLRSAPFALDALSLTMSAALLSQLYASSLFAQLPLVSPLSNVLAAPLFPPTCGMGLAAGLAGVLGLPFADALLAVSSFLAGMLLALVSFASGLPFASVPFSIDGGVALLVSASAGAALWAWWPRKPAAPMLGTGAAALILAALALAPACLADAIVMLDVGQGDSFLITSRGCSMLIDTGNQDARLLRGLASQGIAHIDSVVITHHDDDHCGSLDALEQAVDVDRILLAEGMLESSSADCTSLVSQSREVAREVLGLGKGDSFAVGAFTAKVVWPERFEDDGGNADSLCLMLEYDGDGDGAVDFRALFTGDAEKEQIGSMLREGSVGDIDVLKVGHHGSRNALTPDQARALDPEIALIGVGAGNRYGHPTEDALEALGQVGCTVFRSDEDGAVRCTFSAQGISVSRMG